MSWIGLLILVVLSLGIIGLRVWRRFQRKRKRTRQSHLNYATSPKTNSPPSTLPCDSPIDSVASKSEVSNANFSELPQQNWLQEDIPFGCLPLQSLLEAMSWQAANEETRRLLLHLVGSREDEYLDPKQLKKLPCDELQIIDQLWTHYSYGRFGLGVQGRVWQAVGQDINRFGDIVGWRHEGVFIDEARLIYDLSAPIGHLPTAYLPIVGGWLWTVLDSVAFLHQHLLFCHHSSSAVNGDDTFDSPA